MINFIIGNNKKLQINVFKTLTNLSSILETILLSEFNQNCRIIEYNCYKF